MSPSLIATTSVVPARLRTPMCFLDETGALNSARDPFFAVGMVKTHRPELLTRAIGAIRDRAHFYEEIKWANIDNRQKFLTQYEQVVDAFFAAAATTFSCFVLDKRSVDPLVRYGDLWKAYEQIAGLQVAYFTHQDELPTVLADDMSTPPTVRFEESLRLNIMGHGKQVGGICRADSRGLSPLQVADLLMGAVAYDYKLAGGLVPTPSAAKVVILQRIRDRLGVVSLSAPIRHRKFRVGDIT